MSPSSTADKDPPAEAFDTLVEISVGARPFESTFQAPRGVLSFYSGYFEAAFDGRFIEAGEGAVHPATDDPPIFEILVHGALTRRFHELTLVKPECVVTMNPEDRW
ncbi:hypothetical protein LTR53_014980 [Teratosphaeriaceae sp. CCFEE 6253]|nr:hypothetical protein LTR53_014980 [Teratosphaeriaceae sp. CCFEE 6253]